MNLNIAICDDDSMALKTIPGAISGNFHFKKIETNIDLFLNGKKLLDALANNYDLYFLDIDMPEMDGIVLASKIKDFNKDATIIFVSGREERMYEAFSVQPFGFVRKSNFIEDVSNVINLYITKMDNAQNTKTVINLEAKGSLYTIRLEDILYIVAYRDIKEIHLVNKKEPIEVRYTMEYFEEELKNYGFFRIHKGYIINFEYVSRIDATEIKLINNISFPLSRRRVNDVREAYLKYNRQR